MIGIWPPRSFANSGNRPQAGTPVNSFEESLDSQAAIYAFLEGAGSLTEDFTGVVRAATMGSTVSWSDTPGGRTVKLPGSSPGFIDIGSEKIPALNCIGPMSIFVIFTLNTTGAVQVFAADCNSGATLEQFAFYVNNTNVLKANANHATAGVTGVTTLSSGVRYTGMWTRGGVTGSWRHTVYLNGIQDAQATGVAGNPEAQQGCTIGRTGNFNGSYFNGTIELLKIWNGRELNAAQALEQHNNPYAFALPDRQDGNYTLPAAGGKLFRQSALDGIGSGGPFFKDPLAA